MWGSAGSHLVGALAPAREALAAGGALAHQDAGVGLERAVAAIEVQVLPLEAACGPLSTASGSLDVCSREPWGLMAQEGTSYIAGL